MTTDSLLTCATKLLPAQFDVLTARLNIPTEYLSSPQAPQATRAVELVKYIVENDLLIMATQIINEIFSEKLNIDENTNTAKNQRRAPLRGRQIVGLGGWIFGLFAGLAIAVVCGIVIAVATLRRI